MTKLLSCPFCQSEAVVLKNFYGSQFICCEICGAQTGYSSLKECLVARWNDPYSRKDRTNARPPHYYCIAQQDGSKKYITTTNIHLIYNEDGLEITEISEEEYLQKTE